MALSHKKLLSYLSETFTASVWFRMKATVFVQSPVIPLILSYTYPRGTKSA